MFEIEGKVALVTGGASGIGFETVRQLLKHGAKGVIIADIDEKTGNNVSENLRNEFGAAKVFFVVTDVSDRVSFEGAFQFTLKKFGNIDILVNNAGIYDEKNYEKQIAVNLTGTIHGTLLALEKYILNHRTGPDGVILNTTSVAGCYVIPASPTYSATKSGITNLTLTLGIQQIYEKTKIKVVAIAPGFTESNILNNFEPRNKHFQVLIEDLLGTLAAQPAEFVAQKNLQIIQEKPSGSIWVCEDSEEIYEYIPTKPKKNYY